jgi:transketolase C-terminal domain/subunit
LVSYTPLHETSQSQDLLILALLSLCLLAADKLERDRISPKVKTVVAVLPVDRVSIAVSANSNYFLIYVRNSDQVGGEITRPEAQVD